MPHDDEPPDAPIYFHVVYDDGDEADYTREELMPMLSTHAQSDFRHLAQGHEAAGEMVGEGSLSGLRREESGSDSLKGNSQTVRNAVSQFSTGAVQEQ